MIKQLVKLATDFSIRYKTEGIKVLTECSAQPEFQSLVEHVKQIDAKVLGIQTNNLKSYFQQHAVPQVASSPATDPSAATTAVRGQSPTPAALPASSLPATETTGTPATAPLPTGFAKPCAVNATTC